MWSCAQCPRGSTPGKVNDLIVNTDFYRHCIFKNLSWNYATEEAIYNLSDLALYETLQNVWMCSIVYDCVCVNWHDDCYIWWAGFFRNHTLVNRNKIVHAAGNLFCKTNTYTHNVSVIISKFLSEDFQCLSVSSTVTSLLQLFLGKLLCLLIANVVYYWHTANRFL